MQNSQEIQELLYRTIENISRELINKTNYLYLVEGKVTEIDNLGNCYVFKYQDEDYVGFSITGEKYKIGDLVYVLFSNNKDVKKMILSKTKAFSNNDIRRLINKAQDSADKAKESAQEALDRVQEIGKDGYISPNEKLMIKKDWENIKIEYEQVTEEMELYGGAENTILKLLKEQYDNNFIALKSYIEPILENMTEYSEVEPTEFLEKFNNYYTVRQDIAQAIADITKSIADETQKLVEINQKLLADIANDNKLTPSEKQSVLKEYQGIGAEYEVIIEQAKYYGISYTEYDKTYNELSTYLEPLLADLDTTSDITGAVFRLYFTNYYSERQKLQKAISDEAKDIADNAEDIANEALKNTRLLSIEADGQIFSKTVNSDDFYPDFISLSVKTNVVAFDKFQYKTSTTDWEDVVNNEHGFILIGEMMTISKDSDLFTDINNNITIQALSEDPTIKDSITIIKIQDGVMGQSAISVILTNEAHVFPAGVSAALNSSAETEILAFEGDDPVNIEVKSISTLPTGLTAQISNNNTLKPKITFTATTLLTKVQDVIITLAVNGQEIEKHFSYALGFKGPQGDPGESAWNVILGNDSQNIPCNAEGITSGTSVVDIPVYTYYGASMMASTITVGTLPSGVAATSITNGTNTAPGNVQLTFSTNINLGGKDTGTIDITVAPSPQSKFTKKFSWTKTRQGEDGGPGSPGRTYFLEPSTLIIKKGADKKLSPTSVTFQAYYRDGNTASRNIYSGRFIIQESTNGNNFTTKYTSSANESSKVYTPSSSDIKSIKCILCAADGTTNQLDSQTVMILTDIDGLEVGGRNLLIGTAKYTNDVKFFSPPNGLDTENNYNNLTALRTDGPWQGAYFNLAQVLKRNQAKIGETYTIQIMFKANFDDLGDINVSFYRATSGAAQRKSVTAVPNEWYKVTFTFVIDEFSLDEEQTKTTRIEIDNYASPPPEDEEGNKVCEFGDGKYIWLAGYKLEKGNTATGWTPAPEDIQNDIDNGINEAVEESKAYIDIKENEIRSEVENVKTVVNGHTSEISSVKSSIQQTESRVDTVFTQTDEIRDIADQNKIDLQEYKQYISMEPVQHEGEEEPRPTITLGQSTSKFKVAIDNKEIAFTGASGEKVAYITGDELRINNVVVVRKLAIGDFFFEQEENGHLVLKKGG